MCDNHAPQNAPQSSQKVMLKMLYGKCENKIINIVI